MWLQGDGFCQPGGQPRLDWVTWVVRRLLQVADQPTVCDLVVNTAGLEHRPDWSAQPEPFHGHLVERAHRHLDTAPTCSA